VTAAQFIGCILFLPDRTCQQVVSRQSRLGHERRNGQSPYGGHDLGLVPNHIEPFAVLALPRHLESAKEQPMSMQEE
jgi:hypothetical protein